MTSTLKWLIVVFAVLAAVALIYLGWKKFNAPTPLPSVSSLPSPSLSSSPLPSPSASTISWSTYTNKTFNYSVDYPSNCKVTETSFVTISGPLAENHHWPWFEIYHYDTPFYNPPAGTDVFTWVPQESKVTYDETDPNHNIKIGGEVAIHLKNHKSPQADASDFYYFIHGTQLFGIQIIQIEGKEDWGMYNKFLNSFSFNK